MLKLHGSTGNATFAGDVNTSGDVHIDEGDGSSFQTSNKLRFGHSSWNNNVGIESYWMRFGCNQNEGFKFEDSNSNMLLQLQGGNSTSGNGALSATFAGGVTLKGATLNSYQQFNSDPVSSSDGNNLFTVGGQGMAMGYSRAVSIWSTTVGVWKSWIGTNLRWDGTNYKRASNSANNNWGNIAGILFTGEGSATGTSMKFIIDPPENATGSGEETIGTSLPSGYTALSINNDLSVDFAGNILINSNTAITCLLYTSPSPRD